MGRLLIPNRMSRKKKAGARRSEGVQGSASSSPVSSPADFLLKTLASSRFAYQSEKKRKAQVTGALRIVGRPSRKFPIVMRPSRKVRLTRLKRNNRFLWNTVRFCSNETKIMPVRLSPLSSDPSHSTPHNHSGGAMTQPEDRVREFRRLFTSIEEEVGRVIVGHR